MTAATVRHSLAGIAAAVALAVLVPCCGEGGDRARACGQPPPADGEAMAGTRPVHRLSVIGWNAFTLQGHGGRCEALSTEFAATHASHAVVIGKKNKSPTGDAVQDIHSCLRLIHCCCPWWRLYLRVGLILLWKIVAARLHFIAKSYDMKNAFGTCDTSASFYGAIAPWQQTVRDITGPAMVASSIVDNSEHDLSMGAFIDDLIKVYLVPDGSAQTAVLLDDIDNQELTAALQ